MRILQDPPIPTLVASALRPQGNKKLQQKQKEKKAPQKKTEEELMEEKMRALDNEVTLVGVQPWAVGVGVGRAICKEFACICLLGLSFLPGYLLLRSMPSRPWLSPSSLFGK